MEHNNSLALIVAYYLSKFDQVAYRNLGYGNNKATYERVGKLLGVNPNSVNNMRDEFDPIHENPRRGWYQRPLRPSRAKVVELFQDLSEPELRGIVTEILTGGGAGTQDPLSDLTDPIMRHHSRTRSKTLFIPRARTGRMAEEEFDRHFHSTGEPVPGELTDVRENGCGYDFLIRHDGTEYQVEVKGMDALSGGIQFTSKEWEVAKEMGDTYFLAIVRCVSDEPTIEFIRNPRSMLKAQKQITTVVQVRWQIADSALRRAGDVTAVS